MIGNYYPDREYDESKAPWNEPVFCDCPRCNGTGSLYYKVDEEFNSSEISQEEWESLPDIADHGDIRGDVEDCPKCGGTGEIIDRHFS